jgi:hypothetical protein
MAGKKWCQEKYGGNHQKPIISLNRMLVVVNVSFLREKYDAIF